MNTILRPFALATLIMASGSRRPPGKRPAHPSTLLADITLFRSPFGARNATALTAVNNRDLIAVQWDVSSTDPWRGQNVKRLITHVVDRTKPRSILIFQANGRGWKSGPAPPRIINALEAHNYECARP